MLLPPQAAWKSNPARSMQHKRKSSFLWNFWREHKQTPVTAAPKSGTQMASNPQLRNGEARAACGAWVVMVSVAGVPGFNELGLIEHCGASVGVG